MQATTAPGRPSLPYIVLGRRAGYRLGLYERLATDILR
jgi:hypothetical protein